MKDMENLWIMAQAAETPGQSEVPAEQVGQSPAATGTATVAEPNTPRPTGPMGGGMSTIILIVGLVAIMYFVMFREPKKRQRQQQQMIQSLKKNDKVRTIGGMVGTVVEVRGDEVLVKVDENNNTKIWFVASAIGKNLSNEGK
jgi:preprotein translocase subunit YajC